MQLSISRCLLIASFFVSACQDSPRDKPTAVEEEASALLNAASKPGARRQAVPALVAEAPTGTPYIPPQCYTKTRDAAGRVHNPCYTCHVDTLAPNYVQDSALQTSYDFGPRSRVNPWSNLFVDRSAAIAAISDDEIRRYVDVDNYSGLAARLVQSTEWDSDGDEKWSGFVPDIAFHFDGEGFDRSPDDSYTGWRAYGYFPLPGTFFPTNGSYGDALVRLPEAFRQDASGKLDSATYATNLAILEAIVSRHDVAIPATDEAKVGTDLDGDGRRSLARRVRFRWNPGQNTMTWAGRAGHLQASGHLHLLAGLFPVGTEFAHSLRYLDVQGSEVRMARRMKELRYMIKTRFMSYGAFEQQATGEAAEKASSPHKLRAMVGSTERGIGNRGGWRLQGFIEDAAGALRPQTLQEHAFCIGCHSGVGVTDDSVFSFSRKLDSRGFQRGWFHWSQHTLAGTAEPVRADGRGEYTHYLRSNGAGDELRENDEVIQRFFDARGTLRADMAQRVHRDVSLLLLPSPERALLLDKAYRVIVEEQSFERGRDATLKPSANVHRVLPEEALETGVAMAELDRRRSPGR